MTTLNRSTATTDDGLASGTTVVATNRSTAATNDGLASRTRVAATSTPERGVTPSSASVQAPMQDRQSPAWCARNGGGRLKFKAPIDLSFFMKMAVDAYWDSHRVCTPEPGTPNQKTFASEQDFIDSLVVFIEQRIRAVPVRVKP